VKLHRGARWSALIATVAVFFAVFVPVQSASADSLVLTKGTGTYLVNWSGASRATGQTGWRLQWKLKTASAFSDAHTVDLPSNQTSAYVCMFISGKEEV
jgi:hypothetical protein